MIDHFDAIRGQRVLVTGGLGFCGWNLVEFLSHDLECAVTILDDCSNASRPSRTPLHVEIVEADVRDEAKFGPLVRSHPWVFHLACRTILTCGRDPEGDLTVNALSTLRLLEFLRRNSPRGLKR